MESTSGTPHLLTDVRFTVARKGYDPDEVDNFLERVSAAVAQLQEKLRQATANAEAAEGRATEASRSQTLLQARIDKLESDLATARSDAPASGLPPRAPEDDAAEVSKVLVLAQRTADAAVAEARATATQTVADAEQEAARILITARTEADEAASQQREALAGEVHSLEATRDRLAGDVSALDRYLEDQRASLGGALDRMRTVLDDPGALRLSTPPASAAVAVRAAAPGAAPVPPSPPANAPVAASDEPADSTADDSSDGDAEPEPAAEPQATVASASESAPAPDAGPVLPPDASSDEPGSLFEMSNASPVPHAGPPTAPIAVFDAEAEEAEERFLDNGDAEADAAMRRFFEADFDDDTRFGR